MEGGRVTHATMACIRQAPSFKGEKSGCISAIHAAAAACGMVRLHCVAIWDCASVIRIAGPPVTNEQWQVGRSACSDCTPPLLVASPEAGLARHPDVRTCPAPCRSLLREISMNTVLRSLVLGVSGWLALSTAASATCRDAVVLVHGNSATPASFDNTYDELRRRGCAASEIVRPDWGSKTCAACNDHNGSEETPVLNALVDALARSCTGRIDVVGHSMGVTLAAGQIVRYNLAGSVDSFVGIAGAYRACAAAARIRSTWSPAAAANTACRSAAPCWTALPASAWAAACIRSSRGWTRWCA